MLRDPDGLPVLRGVRTEIAWAEKIRATMLTRFAMRPELAEKIRSIESAWVVCAQPGQFDVDRGEVQGRGYGTTSAICVDQHPAANCNGLLGCSQLKSEGSFHYEALLPGSWCAHCDRAPITAPKATVSVFSKTGKM